MLEEYIKVDAKKLKKYGKIINKTLYLKSGVHCMDHVSPVKNELYLNVKQTIKMV